MALLWIMGLKFTLIWAGNDTNVTNFVSSNKPRTGFFSHVVGIFLQPIDKVFHLDKAKKTEDKAAKQTNIIQYVVEGIEEPIKVVADTIDSQLKAIYPGTQWCGAGDRARSKEDLGLFHFTDECCREHDNCPDNISVNSSKHGLMNNGSFTRSHCDCDDKFHDCLKKANTIVSMKIGITYFNVLQPKCYTKAHPIVGCEDKIGLIRKRCNHYRMDLEAPEEWQWFDAKHY